MRRSFAGLLFGIAFACASLAISGFLLQRTAFSPSASADAAETVLNDGPIRDELVHRIATATALQMYPDDPIAQANVATVVGQVADVKPGAALMAGILRDAHAHLIGKTDGPVQISPQQLVEVTRDQRASVLPAVILPVPRVGALATADTVLHWLVPISAIASLVFFALCFLAHPEKAALIRTLGIGLVVLAALTFIFAWVIPRFVPPLLSDSVWARVPSRLADGSLPLTLVAALLLTGAGLAMFVGSARMGRSRRWSQPVSNYRYREERRWS
ncbi:MAG: hypothetical protein JWN99_2172 [Ilumatobacteraceae bacterium]|nr:hypothetical protein [Ilumatobacteraceae bacterium]